MGPLVIAQFIVCGICLTIGLLHLALFVRMSERKTYLFFALMCSFSGAASFLEALAYRAVSLQAYNSIYKWQVTSQGLLWISMVWFIASFTGTARRWTVPLGGGVGKLFKVGNLPITSRLEAYYNVEKPDAGPDWQTVFTCQFLLPK